MEWFNFYGLIFVAIIMIPNIIYAVKCKDGFVNKWSNKGVELIEQIGRFGCVGFMIINVPFTYMGWSSFKAFIVYLTVNFALIFFYCLIWIICFKKNSIFKALALSILPSLVFLFSGIMCRSLLLIISSLIFSFAHILISYKNAK